MRRVWHSTLFIRGRPNPLVSLTCERGILPAWNSLLGAYAVIQDLTVPLVVALKPGPSGRPGGAVRPTVGCSTLVDQCGKESAALVNSTDDGRCFALLALPVYGRNDRALQLRQFCMARAGTRTTARRMIRPCASADRI